MKLGNDHTVDAFTTAVTGGTEQFFVRRLLPYRPGSLIRLLRLHHYFTPELLGITGNQNFAYVALLKPTPETHGTAVFAAQIGIDTLFNEQNAAQMHRSRSNLIDVWRAYTRFDEATAVGNEFMPTERHWSEEYDLIVPALYMHHGYEYTLSVNANESFTRIEYRWEKATAKELAQANYAWGLDPRDQGLENL